jgi:hypothetical protein
MLNLLEKLLAKFWNRLRGRHREAWQERGNLDVGLRVKDGEVTNQHVAFSNARRTMHIGVVGLTGTGKSSLFKHWIAADFEADRPFLSVDFHGDQTEYILRYANAYERKHRTHLSPKIILIDPTDPSSSAVINVLEQEVPDFVRISQTVQLLKVKWNLDHFGPRTEELMRNVFFCLAANKLTLLEVAPFLTNRIFRLKCLKRVANAEVRAYFESRYDQVSEPMRRVMAEPILNKVSAFVSDYRFRHLVGLPQSTLDIRQALNHGYSIVANFPKGRLGEHAYTLGALLFTLVVNAVFSRQSRSLYSLYLDEVQNITSAGGLETLLAEGRKFGIGVATANQFLAQHSPELRAAILAAATHIFFRLSSADANQVAQALDGGRSLQERLKNLPQRRCIVKSGSERWVEVKVPTVEEPKVDYTDLINRLHNEHTKPRVVIEREIAKRHAELLRTEDELHGWE